MPADNFQNYKRFIKNFYIYKFFKDFVFIYAVYIILFKFRGLSILEISILLSLWSSFVVIFEVPTGALADKWNRKFMLILGMLSKAAGFGVWSFADSFLFFALGFLFWGIQETFCSGTEEALLFDNLKKFEREEEYEKVAGQGYFYSKIAVGISVSLGGFLASYSFELVAILSSLSMIIAIIPTLSFHEVKFQKISSEKVKYFSLMRSAFKEAVNNKLLLRLILYSTIVLAVIGTLDEYEQLYFNWLNLPIAVFGVMTVIRMVFEAIGNKFAYKFQKYFKSENNIHALAILAGIALILSISYRTLFMLPIFAFIFLLGSISEVLVESRMQKEIITEQRATILSINSLLLNISAIVLTVGFGILSEVGDLTLSFLSFALLMILFSTISIVQK
jgi:MFS family permease